MNTYYATLVFCFFIAVVAIFQLALAVGVPWGNVAMAGKFPGRFPPAMRAVAFGGLGFIMNLITSIKWERIIWTPVAGILLVSSLIVAIS